MIDSRDVNLRAELRLDEGESETPYVDIVGKTSIGVGRNLTDAGLSSAEIDYLLGNDIDSALRDCRRAFAWFPRLNDERQRVIVNMVFNMGLPRFRGFEKTIAAVESEDWIEAAVQMLDSKWSRQVGDRATRLAQRMRTG